MPDSGSLEPMIHRRLCLARLSVAALLVAAATSFQNLTLSEDLAAKHRLSKADIDRWMTELSNWGRWGKEDQLGAVNLITPEKRRAALTQVLGTAVPGD